MFQFLLTSQRMAQGVFDPQLRGREDVTRCRVFLKTFFSEMMPNKIKDKVEQRFLVALLSDCVEFWDDFPSLESILFGKQLRSNCTPTIITAHYH